MPLKMYENSEKIDIITKCEIELIASVELCRINGNQMETGWRNNSMKDIFYSYATEQGQESTTNPVSRGPSAWVNNSLSLVYCRFMDSLTGYRTELTISERQAIREKFGSILQWLCY